MASGSALAAAVAELDLTGRRVLELGCGLGLVSVAAAVAGADVVAADQSAEAIAFTTANADRNGVAVRTVRCAFERPEPVLAGAPWDLVLAADVLYEPKTVPALVGLLPRLGRAVWLADPGRPREPEFLRSVDAAGWRRQSRVVTPADALPRVRIHRLSRPMTRGRVRLAGGSHRAAGVDQRRSVTALSGRAWTGGRRPVAKSSRDRRARLPTSVAATKQAVVRTTRCAGALGVPRPRRHPPSRRRTRPGRGPARRR